MQFDLVTPEELLVSTRADYVKVPAFDGEFGVLKGHQAMIAALAENGVVELTIGEETQSFKVQGGFVDVDGGSVTVLAEHAEKLS